MDERQLSFDELQTELTNVEKEAKRRIQDADTLKSLEDVRINYLGKKGVLTQMMQLLGKMPKDMRPKFGERLNKLRGKLEAMLQDRHAFLFQEQEKARLQAETIDVTLPGKMPARGGRHPLSIIVEEIENIFIGMGYTVQEGPDVEWDTYNFERLNIPKHHPAREMQDSFYITEEMLLRTHTSPVQVRTMLQMGGKTPVKIICPGTVYRRDTDDATHSHMFTQIEGLLIAPGIRMSDLKGTLLTFARRLFGEETKIRLRPSFFPFTEPSAEVDVTCSQCGGSGCRVCKWTGWLEVLGAGMVHPNVLRQNGYDPEEVSGFAFGLGVERIAMIKYGIDDIRHFYQGDRRFLKQFVAGDRFL
ncbi:MAG: phenylalanine--tRNA ligase subunit alpha [Candidatus Carbobacillus altaicus]|nr:phenylalanine--tRNA ligase subunit alpha [Candidatus Carbobacillus altaicus]